MYDDNDDDNAVAVDDNDVITISSLIQGYNDDVDTIDGTMIAQNYYPYSRMNSKLTQTNIQ